MEITPILRRIYRWEHFWLCLMVLVTLAMHFSLIATPQELMFDEQHYIKDARSIVDGAGTQRPEHPPLGKLIIAAGVRLLGDNPWGWRFLSVIFGTAGIILFYFLCRRLNMPRKATLLATFLLAFENMTFIQASIAMLDVFSNALMLGAFLLYLRRGYITSGITAGLSTLAKLNGALALPAIAIHWLFSRQGRSWKFVLIAVLAPTIFMALMPFFDYLASGKLDSPFERINAIMSLSGSLTFATVQHEAASRPWEWLLSYRPMAYWYTPHYTSGISFSIWALVIPAALYMLYRAIKGNEAGLFGIAWFASTYLVWIPISILTDRVSFLYYFYPVVGSICLGIGLGLDQLLDRFASGKPKWGVRGGITAYLLLHASAFVILTPVFFR